MPEIALEQTLARSLRAAFNDRPGEAGEGAGFGLIAEEAVHSGDGSQLESRLLGLYRLNVARSPAALMRIGAILVGAAERQVTAIGRYGEALGLATQIVGEARALGRDDPARARALTGGRFTLPVVKALARLLPAERRRLSDLVRSRSSDAGDAAEAAMLIEAGGGVEACLAHARRLVDDAWSELDACMPDSAPKQFLRTFSDDLLA